MRGSDDAAHRELPRSAVHGFWGHVSRDLHLLNTNACAVNERTGDGRSVGRCWFHVTDGRCERHGDVSAVQAEYERTGRLTDEGDLYEARGQLPPWRSGTREI